MQANEEGSKALVRSYMNMLNTMDLSAIDEHFEGGLVRFNGEHIRAADIVAFWRDPFPDLALTVEDQVAEDDTVVTRVRFRGTRQGDFYGIPPTGRHVTWTGVAFDRIVNGKVVEMWHEADEWGIVRQLGVKLAI